MRNDCWICGCKADSGEHIPKSSTLSNIFKHVSQSQPLYLSSESYRNRPLQSINSKLVKFKVICSKCNNSLTQPADKAWDALLTYVSKNIHSKDVGSVLPLHKVFPTNRKQQLINLHHYFIKLFGCVAAQFNIAIDLPGLASSLKSNGISELIHIGISRRDWLNNLTYAGPSDMHTISDTNGQVIAAVWFLTIDKVVFQLVYCSPSFSITGLRNTWNPSKGKNLRLKSFYE